MTIASLRTPLSSIALFTLVLGLVAGCGEGTPQTAPPPNMPPPSAVTPADHKAKDTGPVSNASTDSARGGTPPVAK